MKLYSVRTGYFLHFPREIERENPLWLGAGGVLDLDDPFIAQSAAGQEFKLVEAPDALAPTPINHMRFNGLHQAFLGTVKEAAKPESIASKETLAGIPRPDSRPRKGEEKKHGALSGSLPPSNP